MTTDTAIETAVETQPRGAKLPLSALVFSLALLFILVMFYFPELSGRSHYYMSDHCYYFEPFLRYMGERLGHGQLPLWNPYLYCGMSQVAVPSPGVFYPPVLFFAMDYSRAVAAFMIFHQVVAGFGLFLLIWSLGWGRLPAALGAMSFALCGYMCTLVSNFTLPASAAWLPLLLWSLRQTVIAQAQMRQHKVHQYCLIAALSWTLLLSCGRPEISIPASALALLVILLQMNQSLKNGAFRWQFLAIVIAALLNAPVVLPLLEWIKVSPRAQGLNLSQVLMWSTCWYDWMGMVFLRPFGDLQVLGAQYLPLVATRPVFLQFVTSTYIGPIVFTLSIWGLSDRTWSKRRHMAVLLLVSVAMCVGEYSPIAPWLVTHIQALAVFRYPIKWVIFTILFITICAGRGLYCVENSAVNKRSSRATLGFWLFALLIALALMAVGRANIKLTALHIFLPTDAELALGAGMLSGCALGLLTCIVQMVASNQQWNSKRTASIFVAFAAINLFGGALVTRQMTTAENFFNQKPFLLDVWLKACQKHPGTTRLLSVLFDPLFVPPDYKMNPGAAWTPSFYQYTREVLLPNTSVPNHVPATFGYEAAETGFYRSAFLDTLHTAEVSVLARKDGNSDLVTGDLPLYRFCQATSTHWLSCQDHKDEDQMPEMEQHYFSKVFEDKKMNIRLYEVLNTLPHAYFTPYWKWINNQKLVANAVQNAYDSNFDPQHDTWINRTITSGSTQIERAFDPFATKLADAPTKAHEPKTTAGQVIQSLPIMTEQPEHVCVSVKTNQPGFVVLTDHFYPGWQALVDGVPRLIYNANLESRAVYVPPGSHLVEFDYQPESLKNGLLLASLGGLFAAVLFVSALWPAIVDSFKRMAGQA